MAFFSYYLGVVCKFSVFNFSANKGDNIHSYDDCAVLVVIEDESHRKKIMIGVFYFFFFLARVGKQGNNTNEIIVSTFTLTISCQKFKFNFHSHKTCSFTSHFTSLCYVTFPSFFAHLLGLWWELNYNSAFCSLAQLLLGPWWIIIVLWATSYESPLLNGFLKWALHIFLPRSFPPCV